MPAKLRPTGALDLDLAEKLVLTAAYALFALRMVASFVETGSAISLLFLIDQAVVVGFVIFRRPTDSISRRPSDWILGFAGTFMPLLLLTSAAAPLMPPAVSWSLMLTGFAIHLIAKLTLRRSFGVVAANRGVKASGPYILVRHPMYAGYMLTQLGVLIAEPSLWNLGLIACLWALQVGRILAEERVLGADAAYRDLMRATRYRLVPGVF